MRYGRYAVIGALLILALALAACGGKASPTPAAVAGPTVTSPTGGQSAEDWFRQGNERFNQGDLNGAREAYSKALEQRSDYVDAITNMGVVYYQEGNLEEAIRWFEKALALTPDDPVTNYLMGATFLQQQRLDKAEQYLRKANEADPNMPEPYYGLAVLHKMRGEKEQAIAAFEKFLEIGPGQDPRAMDEARRELRELQGE